MSDSVKQGLLDAFSVLLRPLIRILIRHGVAFGEFSEVVKLVYTQVSEEDFGIPGRKLSQSRVAILTGLTRKEVARLKAKREGKHQEVEPSNLDRVTRVLVGWHTDPEYIGPYGLPHELPFDTDDIGNVSFSSLVRSYSGDMAPRAMLDELLRVGAVSQVEQGWYKVLTRAYVPEPLHPDALDRLGTVTQNFLRTIEINLQKNKAGSGRFERVVYANEGLPANRLPEFNQLIREKGQQLLEELDNWLNVPSEDDGKDIPRIQTGLGIYHYIEEGSEHLIPKREEKSR